MDGTLPVKIQLECEFRYSIFKHNAPLQWYENEGVKIIFGRLSNRNRLTFYLKRLKIRQNIQNNNFQTLFIYIYIYFFLLYNIVLVLPYINMHPPRGYTCSASWTPLPPPSPYHSSGSSQCISPKLLYPASNLDWRFISYIILYVF